MSWMNNPRFERVRESVLDRLSDRDVHFRKVLPVVFLCGGAQSPRRDRVAEFLRRQKAPEVLVFYADDVWEAVSQIPNLNSLEMEEQLASLSDLVIIVVESEGTFAELGAFALAEALREKLLPILDEKHKEAESFIRTGPVAWVDKDSKFGPAIWTDLDTILETADDLEERLARLPKRRGHRIPSVAMSPKHLLFFIVDLAAVFGPCPVGHLDAYVAHLLPDEPATSVEVLVGLAVAMRLISKVSRSDEEDLFYRPLDVGSLRTFQEDQYLNLPGLRAEILGAMLSIPAARDAIQAMAE